MFVVAMFAPAFFLKPSLLGPDTTMPPNFPHYYQVLVKPSFSRTASPFSSMKEGPSMPKFH